MTVTTLEYIHRLLKEAEQEAQAAYKGAKDLQYEYEDHGADKDLIANQKKAADELYEAYSAAYRARADFENKEW